MQNGPAHGMAARLAVYPNPVCRTLGLVRPGSILVLHEGNHAATVTPAALERLLPRLLDEGYRFGTF